MTQFHTIKNNFNWIILAMVLTTILISAPVYTHSIYSPTGYGDFKDHIYFASLIAKQQYQSVPVHIIAHPAYQLLLAGIYWLLLRQAGMKAIALMVQILVQILLVLLIYFWLGRDGQQKRSWLRAAFAFSLSLVAPVMAFVFWDGLYYLGYIGVTSYHNPTTTLIKPAALLSFICILPIFNPSQRPAKVALIACLTVFTALVKPNYLLCILPAVGALAFVYLALKKAVNWRLLVLGLFLPGALVLLAQFLVTYNPANNEGGIIFMPLEVMRGYSGYLLPKLILSMLFPLAVLALNFRKAVRDPALALAWIGFLAGLAQTYLLAEGGWRLMDGNFGWGAEIMLFILFVASVSFLWRETIVRDAWRKPDNIVILAAYVAHVTAGIVYWVYALRMDRPW